MKKEKFDFSTLKKIVIHTPQFSKKNHKAIHRLKNGRIILNPSRVCMQAIRETNDELFILRKEWAEMLGDRKPPYYIHFVYFQETKRRTDLNNLSQMLFDCMVDMDWIEDDNGWQFIPIFHQLQHDKENPRVEFWFDEPELTNQQQFEKYINYKII